jgi:hypothetical protein
MVILFISFSASIREMRYSLGTFYRPKHLCVCVFFETGCCYVAQAVLEFIVIDPPALASRVLGLKLCTPVLNLEQSILLGNLCELV